MHPQESNYGNHWFAIIQYCGSAINLLESLAYAAGLFVTRTIATTSIEFAIEPAWLAVGLPRILTRGMNAWEIKKVRKMQPLLPFSDLRTREVKPFRTQLLKWVGNKQRYAHEIVSFFPAQFGRYFEPFLGSGAVLATLSPDSAIGSDVFQPLVQIWQTLKENPEQLKQWYAARWQRIQDASKEVVYEQVKAAYNANPSGADLLYLCRSCYGGVVRFRKADGYMSMPCGVHDPISPVSFAKRADEWRRRCRFAEFVQSDYANIMEKAKRGDLVYCDPPYVDSQAILYGAQSFSLQELFSAIARCKTRGVFVALSIDGTKRSGDKVCNVPIPDDLFEHEALVNCGRSMLRRFQMAGQTLEKEVVADRLLLTYPLPGC